jgi:hypothetical protein
MRGLSQESRKLIDAARDGDNPSSADRRRVRAALARKIAVGAAVGAVAATATHAAAGGVAAAAGTSGAGAAAGTAAAGAGVVAAGGAATAAGGATSLAAGAIATGFGAKLLVTVAIVGAVSAGTLGYVRLEATKRAVADAQTVAVERATARGVATTRPAAPLARPLAPQAATPPPVAPVVPAPIATADAPTAPAALPAAKLPSSSTLTPSSAPPPAAAPSALDVEIALLQDANGALRMKEGARALRILDERRRRFPNGALAEESEAARVFALCEMGRADEARDVAGRFLREHPRSPLAPRVSRACDEEPSTF